MIEVLLVDDHALFRQGLRGLLGCAADIRVVAEASSYPQAVDMLRTNRVDVLVTDLSLPGRDGIDLITYVKSVRPAIEILALSMHEDEEHATRALKCGALGYVTKSSTSEDLISAIRRVAIGRTYVCPSISENLMMRFTRNVSEAAPHTSLSDREFRIFEMLVQCQTTTKIARELSLSVKTISTHKTRLLNKMGLRHQGELVRYAIEHKLAGL
jgi:DNA-binding NarL/FixJ family response regulator